MVAPALPEQSPALVGLCAGPGLALRIVGTRLARWPAMPVAAVVTQFGDGRDRLDLLAQEDLSVRASLAAGVAAVRSEDEVAGRLSSNRSAPRPTPERGGPDCPSTGVSNQRVRLAREDQVDADPVHTGGPGGYRLPTLVRDCAVELAAAPTRIQRKGHPA